MASSLHRLGLKLSALSSPNPAGKRFLGSLWRQHTPASQEKAEEESPSSSPPLPTTKDQNEASGEDHRKDVEEEGEGGAHVNKMPREIGGPKGPEPTRYGDWEKGGRCCDF